MKEGGGILTALMADFSWRRSVHKLSDNSMRVVVPWWEPHATKRPWSCTLIEFSGSSHTCMGIVDDVIVRESGIRGWWECLGHFRSRKYLVELQIRLIIIIIITTTTTTARPWPSYLYTEGWFVLFEQVIPDIQHSVHTACIEHTWPYRTPATVRQIRHVHPWLKLNE